MNTQPISAVEKQLVTVLKEEYSFYQSLYILLDRQRDMVKFERDDRLLDLYAEVERCRRRIVESDEKIARLKQQSPDGFQLAARHPAVRKLVNSIATLVKKNMALVTENETVVKGRYDQIRAELNQLRNSSKILQYLVDENPSPQFVDGKK